MNMVKEIKAEIDYYIQLRQIENRVWDLFVSLI